jgi:hypothetical protein
VERPEALEAVVTEQIAQRGHPRDLFDEVGREASLAFGHDTP